MPVGYSPDSERRQTYFSVGRQAPNFSRFFCCVFSGVFLGSFWYFFGIFGVIFVFLGVFFPLSDLAGYLFTYFFAGPRQAPTSVKYFVNSLCRLPSLVRIVSGILWVFFVYFRVFSHNS